MPTLTARHPANGLTAIVPGEFVYLIGSDSQVRESLFIDLTLAGISVRGFQCADEFLNSPRRDAAVKRSRAPRKHDPPKTRTGSSAGSSASS